MASIDLFEKQLFFRVNNENFSPDRLYQAIAYFDYGERKTGQLLFVTEKGVLYQLPVTQTRAAYSEAFSVPARKEVLDNIPFFTKGQIASYWKSRKEGI